MAKDVNIHVKTTGAPQAASELHQVANAGEELGAKTSRAAGWMKEAFTALVGPLGIGALVTLAVAGIRKIIYAFDDMKRAGSEAVHELANQQRAAASYFEAMDAYSGPQRRAALARARGVQAATGLPYDASMQLLEAQRRTFGPDFNQQSTEQFAAYWQLHAGPQTTDLVRWMGASGIKTPEQQGKIMRMISAVADKSNLQEEDIITAISSRSERFRAMGWTPEQTITNIGKALGGLSPAESGKAMRGMFESLEGFDEAKAREMKAPRQVASSEQARFEWLKTKAAGLPPEQRNAFLRQAFGPSYPYISKMLFEPAPPEMQKALEYAATPAAAAETAQQAASYRETTEGIIERAKGGAGPLGLNVTRQQELKAAIREYGKGYLEYLRRTDPLLYHKIKMLHLEEGEYEAAAEEMWKVTQPVIEMPAVAVPGMPGGIPAQRIRPGWGGVPLEDRLGGLQDASVIIYNDNSIHYDSKIGESEPRFGREAK